MLELIAHRGLLKRIILQSAKWPLLYLTIGVTLVALSFIDDIFPLTNWKNAFIFTDKVGNIFIALAFLLFVYNLFVYLCLYYEQKLSTSHKIAALILTSFRRGSRVIFILIGLNLLLNIAYPSRTYSFANGIIDTILIASIGWIVIQILYTVEAVLFHHMTTLTLDDHIRVKALYTKMRIIRNIGTVMVALITIAAILMSFSSVRNIGISLLASAGFLTAIIGLSAQKTLMSLFSGLQIALSQPIKIGDIVVIDDISGIVEEITFTYVTLKLGDRRRLVVPINHFIEKSFENWSHEGRSLRSSIHLHVDYLMPVEPLRQELIRILNQSQYWDHVAHKLQVSNLTERTVEVRIQVSAANADDLSDLRAEVREKMLAFMQSNFPTYFPYARNVALKPHEAERD